MANSGEPEWRIQRNAHSPKNSAGRSIRAKGRLWSWPAPGPARRPSLSGASATSSSRTLTWLPRTSSFLLTTSGRQPRSRHGPGLACSITAHPVFHRVRPCSLDRAHRRAARRVPHRDAGGCPADPIRATSPPTPTTAAAPGATGAGSVRVGGATPDATAERVIRGWQGARVVAMNPPAFRQNSSNRLQAGLRTPTVRDREEVVL